MDRPSGILNGPEESELSASSMEASCSVGALGVTIAGSRGKNLEEACFGHRSCEGGDWPGRNWRRAHHSFRLTPTV